jgi:hypothetical protein
MPRLLVVGAGSLARATCLALSALDTAEAPLVTVVGRDPARVREVCTVAAMRAAVAGRGARFAGAALALDSPPDALTSGMAELMAQQPLDAVLVAASSQSPWERLTAPSAWTRLVRRAGFGVTLPFQAQVALAVSRAAAVPVVNACFPDAVNPLLAELGAAVTAGVGNVGLLAAAAQAALGRPDQEGLALLAHHLHLHAPDHPDQEAVAVLDGQPRADVAQLLAGVRAADRPGLNAVTGALAAQLLVDLASGATRDTHLPGVLGLPGGYPVRVRDGGVELRLPEGWPLERALAAQRDWSRRDGVLVDGARVEFGPAAREALAPWVPELADGFATADLAGVLAELERLRDRLRAGEDRG